MADEKTDQQTTEQTTDENAFTKLDPTELPSELQDTYKSMQADYTRKTQEVADLRKQLQEKETTWEEKLKSYGQAEHEVQQWRDWYKSLEEQAQQEGEDPQMTQQQTTTQQPADGLPNYLDEPGNEDVKKIISSMQQGHKSEIETLKQEISSLQGALKDTTDQTSRMFNYHAQLNELGSKYKDLDKQELLDHALKTGQTDLEKAYRDLHQDDLIEQQVKERVEQEMAKQRTQGIKSTGQKVLMRPMENAPKSWAEATEQVLSERAAKGL